MIRITHHISIEEGEIKETFVRSSGPGGQNVNKLATAVQLRFDVARSPSLSDEVLQRLAKLAGGRITTDGELVLVASRYRTQDANRQDARERLIELIRKAAVRPAVRRATRPTFSSKLRRLESKKLHGQTKRLRQGKARYEE